MAQLEVKNPNLATLAGAEGSSNQLQSYFFTGPPQSQSFWWALSTRIRETFHVARRGSSSYLAVLNRPVCAVGVTILQPYGTVLLVGRGSAHIWKEKGGGRQLSLFAGSVISGGIRKGEGAPSQ